MWRLIFLVVLVNAEIPTFELNSGYRMPAIALGTYIGFEKNGTSHTALYDALRNAIDLGYRHIDTAAIYGTEEDVGNAVRFKYITGAINRSDVFITTKLWNTRHKREDVPVALRESLRKLQTSYVDLYLIHWPMGLNEDYSFSDVDFMDTWRGMEDCRRLGLARSIGVSNFNENQLARILEEGSVVPAALQIEVHPEIAQFDLVSFAQSHRIAVMGYSPLGTLVSRDWLKSPGLANNPTLRAIADKYGKTIPQIALRWQIDRKIVPIPKSINSKRLQENLNIFDFKLTEEEISTINSFDRDSMLILPSFWQSHPYYPFKKIDNPMADPFRAAN